MDKNYKVIYSNQLSKGRDKRFVVVDLQGNVLDNAQGYGYKDPSGAYAAYAYKHRDKSKDKEKADKKTLIIKWMKEHKEFVHGMDTFAFEIAKGSGGSDDKFDAKFVKGMLKDNDFTELPFTAGELL